MISEARKDHVAFCKMSPKERALVGKVEGSLRLANNRESLGGTNQSLTYSGENYWPRSVKSQCHLQGVDTVVGFTPSENTCRIETLQSLERPLRAGKNYKEWLMLLRRLNYDLRVLVHELGTMPDYLRTYRSLGDLPSNTLRDDPLFVADLSGLLRESRIEQVQDNHRQGDKLGKRKERSQSRPKDDKKPDTTRVALGGDKKGESTMRPLCKDFVKPEGCRFVRSCIFLSSK